MKKRTILTLICIISTCVFCYNLSAQELIEPSVFDASNEPIDPIKEIYNDDINYKPNLTKRLQFYGNAYGLGYCLYLGDGGFSPEHNPIIKPHEHNPYVFSVEWTQYGDNKLVYLLVALDDGKWKVDNILLKESDTIYRPLIDYSESIQEAYTNHYEYGDLESVLEEISRSYIQTTPSYIPPLIFRENKPENIFRYHTQIPDSCLIQVLPVSRERFKWLYGTWYNKHEDKYIVLTPKHIRYGKKIVDIVHQKLLKLTNVQNHPVFTDYVIVNDGDSLNLYIDETKQILFSESRGDENPEVQTFNWERQNTLASVITKLVFVIIGLVLGVGAVVAGIIFLIKGIKALAKATREKMPTVKESLKKTGQQIKQKSTESYALAKEKTVHAIELGKEKSGLLKDKVSEMNENDAKEIVTINKGFLKKSLIVIAAISVIAFIIGKCNNRSSDSTNNSENRTELNHRNKKNEQPSERVVSFHMEGVDVLSGLRRCEKFSCNMYSGDDFLFGGGEVTTCDIVIPEGQRWAYRDHDADYQSDKKSAWITQPFIELKMGNRIKKYKLPGDGRDVVFYPGDIIRIGTYFSGGHYDYVDVSVVFFVNYD